MSRFVLFVLKSSGLGFARVIGIILFEIPKTQKASYSLALLALMIVPLRAVDPIA